MCPVNKENRDKWTAKERERASVAETLTGQEETYEHQVSKELTEQSSC